MSLRPTTEADLPRMAAIHAASFQEAWSETALAELLAMPGSFALIADAGGFILVRAAGGESELLTLAVEPAARRRGIATALLQAAAEVAVKAPAASMFLEVAVGNNPAIALYKQHGFVEVGRRKAYYANAHGGREDALVLKASFPLTRVGF